MANSAFDWRLNPWWILLIGFVLILGFIGVRAAYGIICIDPAPPEFNDPCHPDLIIYERKQSNGNVVEQRYWSSGTVAIHDGQVFFRMKEKELWLSLPVERVQIKYDLGACLACE